MASSITYRIDDQGSLHLVLYDAGNRPLVAAVLDIEGTVNVIDEIGGMLDAYMDAHPEEFGEEEDTIGECVGRA